MKGENNHFYGKSHTKKTKEKIRNSDYHQNINGKNNPMYGKKHTKNSKEKMRKKRLKWFKSNEHPLLNKKSQWTTERNLKNNPMKDPKVRKKVSNKLSGRESFRKGVTWEEEYGEEKAKKMKKEYSINNPAKRPEVRRKISKSNKKFLLENPERHPNYRLRRDRKTKLEKKMEKILNEMGLKYKFNKYFKTKNTFRFPDFRLINYPLIIEVNGYYTHYTKEGRKKDLERIKEFNEKGYDVLEFTSNQLRNKNKVMEKIWKKLNQLNI